MGLGCSVMNGEAMFWKTVTLYIDIFFRFLFQSDVLKYNG